MFFVGNLFVKMTCRRLSALGLHTFRLFFKVRDFYTSITDFNIDITKAFLNKL